VTAGTPAPTDPLSLISATLGATVDGKTATVQFKGLAPGLVGLYQLNLQIPTTVSAGDALLVVGNADAVVSSARIPVAGQ
jgi:uncharacterized protein (TIGR03437 family)